MGKKVFLLCLIIPNLAEKQEGHTDLSHEWMSAIDFQLSFFRQVCRRKASESMLNTQEET